MEILLVIGLLAALAWSVVYFRWTGLWGFVLATMIAGTVFGYPFFHLGSVTSDRLMVFVSLGIYAVYRRFGLNEPKRWNAADSLFAFFIGMMVLTTFRSDWRVDRGAPVSRLFYYYLIPVIVYWLGRQIELTPQRLRMMFATFAVLGIYLAITAAAEKFEMRWAVFPRYISDPKLMEFLGRGRGPLLNPSANGVLLVLGMACTMMGLAYYGKHGRLLIGSTISIHLLGIYCTLTRCVWMGGAAVLAGILYVQMPKNWRIPFLILILMGGGLIIAAKSENLNSFKRDKNVSVKDMSNSAKLRPLLAIYAWKIFEEYPVFGCGTAQYLNQSKEYLSERDVDVPLVKAKGYVQHNIFLALLTENGLITVIPFTALLVWWSVWAYRLWAKQTLSIEHRQFGVVFLSFMTGYLFIGMFQDLLIMPMINMYLFLIAGCVRNLAEKHLLHPARSFDRLATMLQSDVKNACLNNYRPARSV
jgi:O-Antigen ligase